MDEDKLHQQLNDRIREVFDDLEDPSADEGWLLLREKFPAKAKERSLAWLWYAAAAVVLLGIGLWFGTGKDQPKQQVAQNTAPALKQTEKVEQAIKPADSKQTTEGAPVSSTPFAVKPTDATGKIAQSPARYTAKNTRPVSGREKTGNIASNKPAAQSNATDEQANAQEKPTQPVKEGYIAANQPKQNNTVAEQTKEIATGNTGVDQVFDNKTKTDTKPVITNSAEAMARMLAMDKPVIDKEKKNTKADKKVVIGLYAGTFFNYADGSENRVNVGAGLSSDVNITNHIKLTTGIAIAQNSLNYNYDTYKGSQLYATALKVGLSNAYADNSNAYGSGLSYTARIPKNYRASLIGVDIPLNLKYQFDPKKNDTFISAGVSSGTFLNETYVSEFSNGNVSEKQTTQATFSEFYLAKTLNVSFGVGYPLGKNHRLVVEPFLKYPLGGLGLEQIKFGSGGVNLRFNFSGAKKQ
ncbi:porin family protein [Mucilaginibacter myungsuensis]|uniref:Outer membrane beta-barrel protein n=1 Tax=Mucilaginibacter myungsuensis TaxID=649104 RepID=A0A929L4Y3_9SPHI|nr:outer membrane beta-barrel protein [Mucilaginibacter myungsuensis]MBE9664544.1 outer membrane beta-barrel protein [Mucilaginibacter myungsuensis]MDN3601106.1 outer membrane beta-barrel protein [Mucilaginibacter myungsuensis]